MESSAKKVSGFKSSLIKLAAILLAIICTLPMAAFEVRASSHNSGAVEENLVVPMSGGVNRFVNHGIGNGYTIFVSDWFLRNNNDTQVARLMFDMGNLWINMNVVNQLQPYVRHMRAHTFNTGRGAYIRFTRNILGRVTVRAIGSQ